MAADQVLPEQLNWWSSFSLLVYFYKLADINTIIIKKKDQGIEKEKSVLYYFNKRQRNSREQSRMDNQKKQAA